MDGRPTWKDCDEAGDYVVPNVLDLVSRHDIKDETVPHTLTSSSCAAHADLLRCHLHMARNTLSRNIGYTQTFFILFEQE